MGSQRIFCNHLPVEQNNTIPDSSCTNIKRPPNAFMLFGKDHRKDLAEKHPGVSNKEISVLLGKQWKNKTSDEIKNKYYDKARAIKKAHAIQYPGYFYSPKEARMRKMEKKEKKLTAFTKYLEVVEKNTEYNVNSHKGEVYKEKAIDDRAFATSSSYMPNNPEYAIQPSPELMIAENEEDELSTDYYVGNQPTLSKGVFKTHMTPESRYCNRSASESNVCSAPYRTQEAQTHSFKNAYTTPFHEPTFYNEAPGNVSPLYHPYRREAMSPPLYYQERDDSHNNVQPYSYAAPYCCPDYYMPSSGYFDGTYNRNPRLGLYTQLNANAAQSSAFENEFPDQNCEARKYFIDSRGKETLSPDFQKKHNCKDPLCTQKEMFLEPDYRTTGYLPSFMQQERQGVTPNCFSHFPHASKTIQNKYEIPDAKKCIDETVNVQHTANNILQTSHPSHLSEINIKKSNEPSSFCESESAISQGTSSPFLNNAFPSMPVFDSQFKKKTLDIFGRVISQEIENSQPSSINKQPIRFSSEKPLNLKLENEEVISEPKAVTEAKSRDVKRDTVKDTVDENAQSNKILNGPFRYSTTSKTMYEQRNIVKDAYSSDTDEKIEIM